MLCNGSIRRLPPSPCHNRFQPVALPCLQYLYVTGCADRSAVVRRRQKRGRGVGRRVCHTTQCAADQACPAKAARLYPQRQLNIT